VFYKLKIATFFAIKVLIFESKKCTFFLIKISNFFREKITIWNLTSKVLK